MISDVEQLAVDLVPCDYCYADAGDLCVTRSGRSTTYVHSARSWPLQRAWWLGFTEGLKDATRMLEEFDADKALNYLRGSS